MAKVFGDIGISAQALLGSREDVRSFPATILASDKDHDVSLLEIETGELAVKTIPLELDRGKISLGGDVLAFGQPLGLSQSVTRGMISGFERKEGNGVPTIQTDAAINPGNSGGPMVNMAAMAIGTTSFKVAGAEGVAFAYFVGDQLTALRGQFVPS